MRRIGKYLLHGEALLSYIRRELGRGPIKNDKEYTDYLRENRIKEARSNAIKQIIRSWKGISYQKQL